MSEMGRPTKPLALVEGHRTNDELKSRRDAEQALITGIPIKMKFTAKENPDAAKEFKRITDLLSKIGKNDDLSGEMINLYCVLVSECKEIMKTKAQFEKTLEDFENKANDEGIEFSEKIRMKIKLQDQIISCDKQLMTKRKMILDISKENVMTVQSALRSIPKKQEEKKKSGMAAFMEHRAGGG
jgi:hypothetical protein